MAGVFSDDALLLIGHGSARYKRAGRPLAAHAEWLREHFAEVAVGFLSGHPTVADALASLGRNSIFVAPFFMEDGYFTRVAVPRAVGVAHPKILRFCPPVGTHEGLAGLIEDRVLRWCAERGCLPASLSVVLVGHGSARAPGRRMALHSHTDRLRSRKRFAEVHVAFLEEAPFVTDTIAALRDRPVAVVGTFAGEGMHAGNDLPRLIAAERAHRGPGLFEFGWIGQEAGMARLILEQVTRARLPPPQQ